MVIEFEAFFDENVMFEDNFNSSKTNLIVVQWILL